MLYIITLAGQVQFNMHFNITLLSTGLFCMTEE